MLIFCLPNVAELSCNNAQTPPHVEHLEISSYILAQKSFFVTKYIEVF